MLHPFRTASRWTGPLLSAFLLVAPGPALAVETGDFADCRIGYVYVYGALVDCGGGRYVGVLDRQSDGNFAGKLVCGRAAGSCGVDLPIAVTEGVGFVVEGGTPLDCSSGEGGLACTPLPPGTVPTR